MKVISVSVLGLQCVCVFLQEVALRQLPMDSDNMAPVAPNISSPPMTQGNMPNNSSDPFLNRQECSSLPQSSQFNDTNEFDLVQTSQIEGVKCV